MRETFFSSFSFTRYAEGGLVWILRKILKQDFLNRFWGVEYKFLCVPENFRRKTIIINNFKCLRDSAATILGDTWKEFK